MKSTQSNRPNDKSVKMPSTRKTNQQPARSALEKFNVELPTVQQDLHLRHLTVFQLLVRCVHPWAMRHPRTWSAVARSLTMISSSDCISACITVSMIIVDGLVDKRTENKCFQKMKSQSPCSANAYGEAHMSRVHQVPQA